MSSAYLKNCAPAMSLLICASGSLSAKYAVKEEMRDAALPPIGTPVTLFHTVPHAEIKSFLSKYLMHWKMPGVFFIRPVLRPPYSAIG